MRLPQTSEVFEGRYRLDAVLGEGGFATVYRATEIRSGRAVALKVLKPDDSACYSQELASRFSREVEVLSTLRDPHTVTMYDFGRSATGLLYMVFEYVAGRDLSEVLRHEGQLAPTVAAHIMRQLLLSLREAHANGLLHRDIKPENVRLFESNGDPYRAKLLDFGIARPTVPDQRSITKSGELVGTPRYMSPEALVDAELGPYSDIYSLGLVVFEMLMGPDKLQGHRWADQFDRLVTGHVFSLDEHQRVGPGLRRIVEKMTAREPQNRFPTVDAVLLALDRLLSDRSRESIEVPKVLVARQDAPAPAPPGSPAFRADPTLYEDSTPQERGGPKYLPHVVAGVLVLTGIVAAIVLTQGSSTSDDGPRGPSASKITGSALVRGGQVPAPSPADSGPRIAVALPDTDMGAADGGAASLGCGHEPPFKGRGDLQVLDGLMASASIPMHVPANYDSTRHHPVILLFHQDAKDGNSILDQTRLGTAASERGYVVVAPNYQPGPANQLQGLWVWRDPADVAQIRSAIVEVSSAVCVDLDRVFAVGHGAGGNVIEFLACEDWIRGVATNGFRAAHPEALGCSEPKPYLHFGPMHSKRMLIDGGADCSVATDPVALSVHEGKWRTLNKCSARRTPTLRHQNGTCWKHDCRGADFVTCHIDGGYGWPGGLPNVENDPVMSCQDVLKDFPVNATLLDFFDALGG